MSLDAMDTWQMACWNSGPDGAARVFSVGRPDDDYYEEATRYVRGPASLHRPKVNRLNEGKPWSHR
jgi:hypothetical protein